MMVYDRLYGAWAPVIVARGLSNCSSQALEHRLGSCAARAQLLHRSGIEPVSPALAGGFFATEPPCHCYLSKF